MSKSRFDPIELLATFDWREGDELEFKSAQGGLPRSLWETYAAMANTHGGVILLGIEDNGWVSGLPHPVQIQKAIWDTLNNQGKVSINLIDASDVREICHEGKVLLAMRVPQATRDQKPVFIGQNPLTGTYRRNYEGDYRCTEQEVRRMLADHSSETPDRRILEGYGIEDLDRPSLQQYRNRFASFKPTHPWLNESDQGLLEKLGGWRRDRKDGREGLTVAGLLMFGRDETLREALPSFHVDYRERLSEDPAQRWSDRLTADGTWQPNLFQFYLRVAARLFADLKLPFHLDDALFRKGESPVHEALREALVNALIHADYSGQGGIVVEKCREAFIFSNPGTLLVSLDQLLRGQVSECRNKTLQNMFMMMGAAEKAGSGLDKIRQGWASQQWRAPQVSEQLQPDRVVWRLPMSSLLPAKSLERLQACFGPRFAQFNHDEVLALVTADVEDGVDNARLRQISSLHTADITRLLQALVARKALAQEGQGRWSRYRIATPYALHDDSAQASPSDSLHKPEGDSLHKGGDTLHKSLVGQMNASISDSLHKPSDDSLHNVTGENSGNIPMPVAAGSDPTQSPLDRESLVWIAHIRAQKRLSPSDMEQAILRLCKDRWLTRHELSTFLGRNSESLRQRFLTPMVQHGLLRLRHPDKPNRVDQAYTATTSP